MSSQGFQETSIHRIYICSNPACKAQVSYQQKVKDKWKKRCPLCGKHTLFLDKAVLNIMTFIDLTKPKTFGAIGEKNNDRRLREEGDKNKKKVPFWRKNKKINYNILKNPNNYVATGSV